MNYKTIKKYDIANAIGIHTSIFFTGCKFHCHNCFNKEIWDFNSGEYFDKQAKDKLYEYISDEHVKGLSILGGEPLQQGEELLNLLKEIKIKFPNKRIWLWTGYYLNELNDLQKEIISYCDRVIDGRFDNNLKNYNLKLRGSSNQSIYDNINGEFVKIE